MQTAGTAVQSVRGLLAVALGLAAGLSPMAHAMPVPPNPYPGPALSADWPRQALVLTDSVVLGAKSCLTRTKGWQVTVEGREALHVRAALRLFKARVGAPPPVVVFALGYNSNWEPKRHNFQAWANRFDAQADALVKLALARGARKVVWVLLRELSPASNTYGYYFPYVNERLLALRERHPELALADWRSVAKRKGLTADAIHLNARGGEAMAAVIRAAIGIVAAP